MRKHTIMKLPALVVLFVMNGVFAQSNTPERTSPNILFIMADDLGYNEVGCFGQEKIKTPNLDQLAGEGMRLTRHYSGSAVCAPTRSMLMTGLHAGHATIRGNRPTPGGNWKQESPEGQWPIPAEDFTIAEMLKERGYATGAFGKWGLGGPGSTGHPCNQGFDHFYGYLCQRVAHNYYPTHLWRNHDVDILNNNKYFKSHQQISAPLENEAAYAERFAGGDYAPDAIITELLGWVRKQVKDNPDQPFFCYYPTMIPHVSLQVPQQWVDEYPREWDKEHYLGDKGYLPHPRARAAYAGMISYMDHNIGRVLDLLDELGVADNTIVVFTSDNGSTYVSGVDTDFFNSLGNLRGHKGNLWEGGIRMPTIVRWPGHIEPNSTSTLPSYHPDWMPTLAKVAGAQSPAHTDGVDLLPSLTGEGKQKTHEFMYWEFPEGAQQQVLLLNDNSNSGGNDLGRWKIIKPKLRKNPELVELYDLTADPGETNNVAKDHHKLVGRALQIMRREHQASDLFPIKSLDAEE